MFGGWDQTGDAELGLLPERVGAPINDILAEMRYTAAGLGYLEWVTYRDAAELHTQLVEPEMVTDLRMLDAMTQCGTRIATARSISQGSGEGLLHRAVALRDRLPSVLECLKLGLVSPHHIRAIVSRTDLIDGQDYAADIDAAIAESLRKKGSWSDNRMRDMIDRIIYRHDPDAVRERRTRAKDDRTFWLERGEDGMAEVGASMTAENALLAHRGVCELADQVCPDDGRSQAQRRSDASFALQTGTTWECQCSNVDCSAGASTTADTIDDESDFVEDESAQARTIDDDSSDNDDSGDGNGNGGTRPPGPQDVPSPPSGSPSPSEPTPSHRDPCHTHPAPNRRQRRAAAKHARLHAYTDPATAGGDADNPGFLDGYGVICADHVRDLVTHPGVRVHVMANRVDAAGTVIPFPSTQPADPYRPSTALRTYVRARDQYCVWPGCNKPATTADLYHTDEYDHHDPTTGGQTTPHGMVALCRFHHLLKTFGTWITDQTLDAVGRTRTTVTTPEGLTVDGPAHTGDDLIPGLIDIEFARPANAPPRQADPDDEPTRRQTRLADKYARRRYERERNRARREGDIAAEPEPPF